jgi:hypothetical protein
MALSAQNIKDIDTSLSKLVPGGKQNISKQAKTYTIMVSTTGTSQSRKDRQKLLEYIAKNLRGMIKGITIKYEPDTSGKIIIGTSEVLIYAKDLAKSSKPKFKPSDIVPSIVNTWLEPAAMVANVTKYIQKVDIGAEQRKSIIHLLEITAAGTTVKYTLPKFPRDLVPSEFFEVLSAIKLSVLLKANDAKIKKILGIQPRTNLSQIKTKIYIPQQSNFPLVDYFISISPTGKESETSALKISVKSKVSSAKTNTVKFKDMYDKPSDVTKWYNDLTASDKRIQKGQKIIGESVIQAYNLGANRIGPRAPVLSLIKLIEGDRSKIEPLLAKSFKISNVNKFKTILEFVNQAMAVTAGNPTFGVGIKTTATQQKEIETFIKNANIDSADAGVNLFTFCYICDKIIVESSRESSTTKYNFYQMFYDEVLKRQHVAYAVSSFKAGVLSYDFYTAVNWLAEYKKYWIALRNQSGVKEFNAPIGLDV